MFEETLVIVKPDGLTKGLVGEILSEIEKLGLVVVGSVRTRLDREWVEMLYDGERGEPYFEEVVSWVSSDVTLLLKVRGKSAVELIKWSVLGRYPSGIRGKYAENWIRNVAHAPESVDSARKELELAQEHFAGREKSLEERLAGKVVFALTGMSESGKSTVGKYFDQVGIPRLKIGKIFKGVTDRLEPGLDQYEVVRKWERRDPYHLWDQFIDELIGTMDNLGRNMVSIESLYGDEFGKYLQRTLGEHFCLVYVDAPAATRARYQKSREGLRTLREARALLAKRDSDKQTAGIPSIKRFANVVIRNTGSIEDLYGQVDSMIANYRPTA